MSYKFLTESTDQNHWILYPSQDGSDLSEIIDNSKYYYSIHLCGKETDSDRIGIYHNLNGKYAVSFLNSAKLKNSQGEKIHDICKIKWMKFQTKKVTISSIHKVMDKYFLMQTFK
jgi:hypothetical protein